MEWVIGLIIGFIPSAHPKAKPWLEWICALCLSSHLIFIAYCAIRRLITGGQFPDYSNGIDINGVFSIIFVLLIMEFQDILQDKIYSSVPRVTAMSGRDHPGQA